QHYPATTAHGCEALAERKAGSRDHVSFYHYAARRPDRYSGRRAMHVQTCIPHVNIVGRNETSVNGLLLVSDSHNGLSSSQTRRRYLHPANVLTLCCESAAGGLASSGAPLAAHPRNACASGVTQRKVRWRSRLGRRECYGGSPATTASWAAAMPAC